MTFATRCASLALLLVALAPGAHAAAETESLQMYNVTDLVPAEPMDAPRPLGIPYTASAVPTAKPSIARQPFTLEQVLGLFEPGIAALLRGRSEMRSENTLFVRASSHMQQHISDRFDELRNGFSRQVNIDVQLFLMPPHYRQEKYAFPNLAWIPVTGYAGQTQAIISNREARRISDTLKADSEAVQGEHPTLTIFSGQRAYARWGQPEPTVVPDVTTLEPKLVPQVIDTGYICWVTATATKDLRFIDLNMEWQIARKTGATSAPFGFDQTFEMPTIWSATQTLITAVGPGESAIIATGILPDKQGKPANGYLLVSAAIMSPDDLQALVR